jgi:two-component system, OmpR family, sensor kinase
MLHTMKFRLQLWYGSMLALVLLSFGALTWTMAWSAHKDAMDTTLRQKLDGALRGNAPAEAGPPPPGQPRKVEEVRARIFRNIAVLDKARTPGEPDFYIAFVDFDATRFTATTNAPAQIPAPKLEARPAAQVMFRPRQLAEGFRTRGELREAWRILPLGDVMVAGYSMDVEASSFARRMWWLPVGGLLLLAVGLAGGWRLAVSTTQPLNAIRDTASHIASSADLSQRISVPHPKSEAGQLASVLNFSFARLEEAFARQARFTADAAHELRTPVSVLLTRTQTTLNRDRSTDEYKDALQVCLRAGQRMKSLTESLLLLSRLEAVAVPELVESVNLSSTAQEAVEALAALAETKQMKLQTHLATASCRGNQGQLLQVALNLIGNAIQHSPPGGVINIETMRREQHAVLVVSDDGAGIPAEHQSRIFERFYRADPARSSGGAGLGLAIVQAIVKAHGGDILLRSGTNQGTRFEICIPG